MVPSERAVFFYQTQFLFQELFVQAYSSISKTSKYSAHTREQIVNEIAFAVERVRGNESVCSNHGYRAIITFINTLVLSAA